jgi:hypothetical protein
VNIRESSDPGSLKQTSFIVHYLGWQAASGFLVRRAVIDSNVGQIADATSTRATKRLDASDCFL